MTDQSSAADALADMAADEAAALAAFRIIDNPFAPELFACDCAGFMNLGGQIALTFTSRRCDHSADGVPANNVVCHRLVMPTSGAIALAVGLFDFLKTHGLAPEMDHGGKFS